MVYRLRAEGAIVRFWGQVLQRNKPTLPPLRRRILWRSSRAGREGRHLRLGRRRTTAIGPTLHGGACEMAYELSVVPGVRPRGREEVVAMQDLTPSDRVVASNETR
jgi:hypothetical protein